MAVAAVAKQGSAAGHVASGGRGGEDCGADIKEGSQALELTRAATAEQKSRLDFLSDLQPDCSSAEKLEVRVLEQPQHGTLAIENGQAFTEFPQDDRRAACNARQSDGRLVFYQPDADYRGADSITLSVTSPVTGDLKRHYAIDVK